MLGKENGSSIDYHLLKLVDNEENWGDLPLGFGVLPIVDVNHDHSCFNPVQHSKRKKKVEKSGAGIQDSYNMKGFSYASHVISFSFFVISLMYFTFVSAAINYIITFNFADLVI